MTTFKPKTRLCPPMSMNTSERQHLWIKTTPEKIPVQTSLPTTIDLLSCQMLRLVSTLDRLWTIPSSSIQLFIYKNASYLQVILNIFVNSVLLNIWSRQNVAGKYSCTKAHKRGRRNIPGLYLFLKEDIRMFE